MDTYPENTFGQRLRKARSMAGLQVQEVATMAGIEPHTLSAWESDKYKPRHPGKLKRVADVLEAAVEYLIGPLPNDASLGERLVYYRTCKGLSQIAMANLLGVARETVADAERGKDKAYIRDKLVTLDREYFEPVLNKLL